MLSSWLGTDRLVANRNGGMLRLIASCHDDTMMMMMITDRRLSVYMWAVYIGCFSMVSVVVLDVSDMLDWCNCHLFNNGKLTWLDLAERYTCDIYISSGHMRLLWCAAVIFLGSFHSPEVIFEQVSVAYAMPRYNSFRLLWDSQNISAFVSLSWLHWSWWLMWMISTLFCMWILSQPNEKQKIKSCTPAKLRMLLSNFFVNR